MLHTIQHQYVERDTGRLCTEMLCSDRFIQFLYSEPVREQAAWLFQLLTSYRLSSQLLALLSFDLPFGAKRFGIVRFLQSRGINFRECVDPDITTKTARAIFERQIRYWECRPMPQTSGTVIAPADARLVLGSLRQQSLFFIKEKFFAQFIAVCSSAKPCEIGENLLCVSDPISRLQERLIDARALIHPPTLQHRTLPSLYTYAPV